MMTWLEALDVSLFRQINTGWTNPFLDHFLSFIANFNLLKWPLGAGVLAIVIWGSFRARLFMLLMLACLLFGDAGVNWAIKRTAERPRPHQSLEDVRRVQPDGWGYRVEWSEPDAHPSGGRSMPSGHMCNNVAIAFLLTRIFPPWGALAWIWALLMGWSRIYTGDHYPGDVLVSLIVATLYSALICCAASRLWQNIGPRFFAQTYARHPRLFP